MSAAIYLSARQVAEDKTYNTILTQAVSTLCSHRLVAYIDYSMYQLNTKTQRHKDKSTAT